MSQSGTEREPLLAPAIADPCTEMCYTFMRRHATIFEHFLFNLEMATRIDQQRQTAAKVLAEVSKDENLKRLKNVEKSHAFLFRFLEFQEYDYEVMCIRLVDNFLCFLSELIQSCMLKRPEMLKSSEMVRIEDILNLIRKSDIIRFLVDRKINELSYAGISGIKDFLESRTGVELTESPEEWDRLTIAIELRNIYTHNRGKINELFLRRIGSANSLINAKIGERFHTEFEFIIILSNNLYRISRRLDHSVSSKFKIRRRQFGTWYISEGPSFPPKRQRPK